MGDSVSATRAFWKYPDLRRLAEHAATYFPDRAFFLSADEKLPSVTGAELYGLCKKAAAVLDGFDGARHIALLGPGSAAWLAAFFAVLSAGRVIVPLHDGISATPTARIPARASGDKKGLTSVFLCAINIST